MRKIEVLAQMKYLQENGYNLSDYFFPVSITKNVIEVLAWDTDDLLLEKEGKY